MFKTDQNSTAIKTVHIFEPCLGSMTGHWESNARRFRDEFLRRGLNVHVFCQTNPDVEILKQYNATPLFTTMPFNDISTPASFNQEYLKFKEDFNRIDSSQFKKGDLLLFPTVLPHAHKAAMEWLDPIISATGPKAAFIFMIAANDFPAPLDDDEYKALSKLTRLSNSKRKLLKKFYLWKDCAHIQAYKSYISTFSNKHEKNGYYYFGGCEEYAMNFEEIFGVPIRSLPFPTITTDYSKIKIEKNHNKTVKVGYFGHASLEKGAQFLEHVVNKTLKECPHVQFELHINPNIHTQEILTKFSSKAVKNVHFHHGHREYNELVELMHNVDINLLPYSPVKYAGVPSMVFTEAVNAGNILVVPEYTWLSREASIIKTGHTAFNSYDEESVADALILAVKNFKKLKRKTTKGRARFLRRHNIEKYMKIILNTVSNKQPPALIRLINAITGT